MFDLGDPVPLSVKVTDANGNLANATAITLTVTTPSGTTSNPSTSNPSTGIYTATYTPAAIGRHLVRWVATGTNASAFTDVFDVRPAASIALFSLADARAMLNASATTNDEEIRQYVDATTIVVEGRVGPVIPRAVTELIRIRGRSFVLSYPPIVSIDSIGGQLIGAWPEAVADLAFDPALGIVRRLDRALFPDDWYTVGYTAGRANVIPPNISLGAQIIMRHLWEGLQRGPTVRPGAGPLETITTPGYAIPNAAAELLTPSLIVDGIA